MDELTTTGQTLRVTLKNGEGGTKTIAFNNPVDGLTLTQIRTAFSGLLSNSWLLDTSGVAYTSVSEAAYVTVTQITDY